MSGTNVLLVGANFINKGAEAMAKTVRQELAKAVPDLRCAIVVTADQAEAARAGTALEEARAAVGPLAEHLADTLEIEHGPIERLAITDVLPALI